MDRLRWGALAWLLTLQFFVAEAVAAARYDGSYSYADDVISALGAAGSDAAFLMNASFVLQGVLIGAGTVLLRPFLQSTAGRVATVLLLAAAAGVLLVGVFPTDTEGVVHEVGAGLHLLGGALGLLALAYAVRRRSEAIGTAIALAGMLGTAATIFFGAGVIRFLGEGGTERVAGYVVPVGLALAAIALWRGQTAVEPGGPSRYEQRQVEQARRAAAAAERDAVLERHARGQDDADDPWAPTGRQGD
jgi:hypothetical membrane protein